MTDMAGNFRFAGTEGESEAAEADKIVGQLNKLSCLRWFICRMPDGQQAVAARINRPQTGLLVRDRFIEKQIILDGTIIEEKPLEEDQIFKGKDSTWLLAIELFEIDEEWKKSALETADAEAQAAASQEVISAVFSEAPILN